MITLTYGNIWGGRGKKKLFFPQVTTLRSYSPLAQFINGVFLIWYFLISQKWMWRKK